MNKNLKRGLVLLLVLMVALSSVFAGTTSDGNTTTTTSTDPITTVLTRIGNILKGPITGVIFIGLFIFKMVWAYAKHNSQPDAMKKEILTALLFAACIAGFMLILGFLMSGSSSGDVGSSATGSSTVIKNFSEGLKGATVSVEYLKQAALSIL